MHLAPLIQDLAILLLVAAVVAFVFRSLRQPLVLGYLVAGVIVGPHTPPFSLVIDLEGLKIWSELGVVFLMFGLGLEFSFRKLAQVGRAAYVTGVFEALFMLGLGLLTGKVLGWSLLSGFYLGAVLAISSTTIILKSFEELKMRGERFTEQVFGILIVEDLVGILLLVILTQVSTGQGFSLFSSALALAKLLALVGVWIAGSRFVIPPLVNFAGRHGTDETLLLFSLGLCLLLVAVAAHFQYSTALGAFLMGSAMAESREAARIHRLHRPLQDVFAAVFFVSIGMLLNPADLLQHAPLIFLLTLLTFAGKIGSGTLGARLSGQTLGSSLRVGFSLAQIGEFSFIIAGLGLSTGQMEPALYPAAVAVSIITTFTTPYFIRGSKRFVAR